VFTITGRRYDTLDTLVEVGATYVDHLYSVYEWLVAGLLRIARRIIERRHEKFYLNELYSNPLEQ
jgi:hypothetical protein